MISVYDQRLKLMRSYPEVVSCFLKKIATKKAIVEFDAAILRLKRPVKTTLHQIAGKFVAKSRIPDNVHEEQILNDVFIEEMRRLTNHSLRHYWAPNPKADLTVISLQAESMASMQKFAAITLNQTTYDQ